MSNYDYMRTYLRMNTGQLEMHIYMYEHGCFLCGQIKGFSHSITTILFEAFSDRTVVG